MISDKAASLLQSVFWILLIAIVYFFAYLGVIGTLQGMLDSSESGPVPWPLGLAYAVFAFPVFYLMPVLADPLRQLIGDDNNAIFALLGLNGICWGFIAVTVFRLIARYRSRRTLNEK